jgi:hypothetical protein
MGCATEDPDDIDLISMSLMQQQWEYRENITMYSSNETSYYPDEYRQLQQANRRYTVPVFFTILAKGTSYGVMSLDDCEGYITILNQAFEGSNFEFVYQGAQRRFSAELHNCSFDNHDEWKPQFYIAGSNALNLYICDPVATILDTNTGDYRLERILGVSTWPTNANSPTDGVIVPHHRYYGHLASHYFTVHEVGHWLAGLLHTFSGGCSSRSREFEGMFISDGDGVDDTPAHATQTWDVLSGIKTCWKDMKLDTCPDSAGIDAGLDPVDNCTYCVCKRRMKSRVSAVCILTSFSSFVDLFRSVMNYVEPTCWAKYGEFTPGQHRRMLALFEQFRLDQPWQCQPVAQTCRGSFECCNNRKQGGRVKCVIDEGETQGICVEMAIRTPSPVAPSPVSVPSPVSMPALRPSAFEKDCVSIVCHR